MKFLVSLIVTMLLSFTSCLYFPWWSIAVTSFIVAVAIPQSSVKSFLTGFLALFMLWAALSFWISVNNDHILAHRVSLLVFKIDNPYLLMLVTALVGGLVASFAAMTGSYCRGKKKPSHVIT